MSVLMTKIFVVTITQIQNVNQETFILLHFDRRILFFVASSAQILLFFYILDYLSNRYIKIYMCNLIFYVRNHSYILHQLILFQSYRYMRLIYIFLRNYITMNIRFLINEKPKTINDFANFILFKMFSIKHITYSM